MTVVLARRMSLFCFRLRAICFGSLGWFCLVRAGGWLLGGDLVVGAFWFDGGVCNWCSFLGGCS
jgi:hypothetical protein